MSAPLRVVVAGGGVAGLETMLALGRLAGDRVATTLLDPAEDFVYRPMTVAEPFGAGHAIRHPLGALAEDAGARHVRDRLERVDPAARVVRTARGAELPYDALVLALGAEERPAYAEAITFDPLDTASVAELLRDLASGTVRRVAVVVPPGPHWTLPAYELGLLLAGNAAPGAQIAVVVPEPEPLGIFGPVASEAIRRELEAAGVRLEARAFAEVRGRTVILHPGGRALDVDRVLALPRLMPRTIPGIGDEFLPVDGFGRLRGVDDVYAVGDGTSSPIKQGGLAAQQADAAATHLAARAGTDVRPTPFRPILRGRLLTPRGDRWLRHDPERDPSGRYADHALWWPPDKIAGRHLSHALARRDPATGLALQAPPSGTEFEVLVAAQI
jgi:sulfide:quinone oxidoreductase